MSEVALNQTGVKQLCAAVWLSVRKIIKFDIVSDVYLAWSSHAGTPHLASPVTGSLSTAAVSWAPQAS